MPRRRLVTLSTDFGSVYSAQLKAVLAGRLGPGRFVELADDLPARSIPEAAFLLRAMAARFPPGTVHLAVVDPGVGGRRAPVAVDCRDGSRLVGPNNGLLVPLAEALGGGRAYRLPARPTRRAPTFDGRELFAPAAAELANGRRPATFGPAIGLERPKSAPPVRRGESLDGVVEHVDRFGNLITNLPGGWLPHGGSVRVEVGRRAAVNARIVRVYEDLQGRELGALVSSFGTVELCRSGGAALPGRTSPVGRPIRIGRPDRRGHPSKYSRR